MVFSKQSAGRPVGRYHNYKGFPFSNLHSEDSARMFGYLFVKQANKQASERAMFIQVSEITDLNIRAREQQQAHE